MTQDYEYTPLPETHEPPDFPASGEPPPEPPRDSRPRREGVSPLWIGALLLVLAGLTVAAWWWFMGRAPEADEPRQLATTEPRQATPPPPSIAATEQPPPPDLPPLDASDSVLRDWVGELSQHPQLARWLLPDDLARRFVATVDNIARGESPRPHLSVLEPRGSFSVIGEDHRAVMAPDSYRRYDLAVEVFSSLDIAATARLFHTMEPLLEDAFQELGDPSRDFRTALAQAIDHLLAVKIPAEPPVLEKSVMVYRFVDPELEAASPVAKQMLRLGPENARKVQNKLRFFRAALDLPE